MKENVSMLGKRDTSLDVLRSIGLLFIILAHVNPPVIIFQLRNFDVPLMVFISGIVFGVSSGVNKGYLAYLVSRVRRLVFPTWIFLTIFFSLYLVVALINRSSLPFSSTTILNSYNLVSGIGYVWIIRVFLLVALTLPFLVILLKKVKNNYVYIFVLGVIYFTYEVLYHFYSAQSMSKITPVGDFIFQNIVFYVLPFSVVAGLGLIVPKLNKRFLVSLTIIFLVIFILLVVVTNFAATQGSKYPPQLYYLSYAIFISFSLYLFSKTKIFTRLFNKKIILFIGSYSLWIYLWQILLLSFWSLIPKQVFIKNFITEFFFVLFFAIAITYLQRFIIKIILSKLPLNSFGRFLLVDGFLK